MTTTYYINDIEIESNNTIGVSIERYHSQDYWSVRLYVQDVFTNAITSSIIPNTTGSVSIEDDSGTAIYDGTVTYWASSPDYSYVDFVNCTVSFTPAP
jgi:hypothetical protein